MVLTAVLGISGFLSFLLVTMGSCYLIHQVAGSIDLLGRDITNQAYQDKHTESKLEDERSIKKWLQIIRSLVPILPSVAIFILLTAICLSFIGVII